MISKELLSEVLKLKIDLVEVDTHRNKIFYYCNQFGRMTGEISPFELAFLCKEWAWETYKLSIISGFSISGNKIANIMVKRISLCQHHYKAETEYEAIFQACEWIFKEKLGPTASCFGILQRGVQC